MASLPASPFKHYFLFLSRTSNWLQAKMIFLVALLASLWLSSLTMLEGVHGSRLDEHGGGDNNVEGKRWAILVAGSNGYENYRHQADVCHAYQILKKGGLKDENIIVFMYDDIAFNKDNPRPGVIINKPNGPNVYQGVPKDYTGKDTNVKNFYGVISGNRSAIRGGSGKVLDSGPNDVIFIYYSDHGASGFVTMPVGEIVVAKDFIDVLKKKHAAKGFKKMVIYVEACEAGSMFEGLLPHNISIYATTASNSQESSYAAYCPDQKSNHYSPPPHYDVCLGDIYSVSWMEDSDRSDRTKETLKKQYEIVRNRTLHWKNGSSHVMEYGDRNMSNDFLVAYIGADHAKVNEHSSAVLANPTSFVSQRDALLLHLKHKLEMAPHGSNEKLEAQKRLAEEIAEREHADKSVKLIGDLLFGEEKSTILMTNVRPPGQPLVDDWDCFKKIMKAYESHCGILSSYGKKYSRAFANMCNAGVSQEKMVAASSQACPNKNHAY